MNPDNRGNKSNNNRTSKAIAAMPIAGIVVAASLLLSGLSVVGSYHLAFAQQNMTGGGGNVTTGGNATTTGAAAAGNQTELIMHLEEVRTALQNNDIQGAMLHLDLALNLLGVSTQANTTSTTGSTNSTA
jgi:hypothetical protein